MVYIRRNVNLLVVSIGCEDEGGKTLCKDIIEGKVLLSKKKALVETLLISGLIPDKYLLCPITVTDKRSKEDKSVDISCDFSGTFSKSKEDKLIDLLYGDTTLNLSLSMSAESFAESFYNDLEMISEGETKYFKLKTLKEPVLVLYR